MATAGTPIGLPLDIPDFTISGILPPFQGPSPLVPALMSPYQTTLPHIAVKLCSSNERRNIFRGLLAYRQELNAIGLSVGFQWLSGSFMEDIETLEARSPNDVDVVTFCHRPPTIKSDTDWQAFVIANMKLIDSQMVKATFMCDAYFVDLDITPLSVVNQTRYWFGLFSHRRGGLWKGMLQIPLIVTNEDADASVLVGP